MPVVGLSLELETFSAKRICHDNVKKMFLVGATLRVT